MMSKDQEKEKFARFIKGLEKDSYLYSMLAPMQWYIEKSIDDDTGICLVDTLKEEERTHDKQVAALQGQLEEARRQVALQKDITAAVEREKENVRNEYSNKRDEVIRLKDRIDELNREHRADLKETADKALMFDRLNTIFFELVKDPKARQQEEAQRRAEIMEAD